ncbi:MAG TPA: signal peptide peptidase SppA [Vicinamibacterales bacterium]|nr:signal peptide peptidase SppA [Vicinamibacterales bacterium]
MASRRGVVIVFALLAVAVMFSISGLVLLSMLTPPVPTVQTNSTLELPLQAPFQEIDRIDLFSPLVDRPLTLRHTVDLLRRARTDDRITSVVVRPRTAGALWGQLQEVRAALLDFRTSGKPVTAYLEYGGAGEYYLASAADRVLMMPAGQLDLTGVATYEIFLRGTMDKLGVFPDLLHIGEYKTASNTFTEKTFTPAHREMTRDLTRSWFDELVRAIAESRKLSDADVRTIIDQGPFLAAEAQEAGLVDALAYEDQIADGSPVPARRTIKASQYSRSRATGGRGPRIALLYAAGTIASGRSSYDMPGAQVIGSDTFAEWVRRARNDSDIRAIVVRVDSPGGSAIASEVIWRELMLARDVKPVVVSMGDVAASGGYYIAAPAHAIVAQPGTITGSIGVVTGKYVLQGSMDKLGVGTGSESLGRFAEMYSPFRPFTRAERDRVDEQMQATYDLFVTRVADGRQSTREKIDAVAQGRVWTGRQASELGLVDELGGLDRAIAIARERARIDADGDVTLVVYPPRRSFYEIMANPLDMTAVARLSILFDRPEVRALETITSVFGRFRSGEPLAIMPNVLLR